MPDFETLEGLVAWAKSYDVTVEAEMQPGGGGWPPSLCLTWLERAETAPPGTGATVMHALCRHADRHRARTHLQAHDEVNLPDYYRRFGFVETGEGDGDVRQTGPDMVRKPRKLRNQSDYAVSERIPPSSESGVCVVVLYSPAGSPDALVVDLAVWLRNPGSVQDACREAMERRPDIARFEVRVADTPRWNARRWKNFLRTGASLSLHQSGIYLLEREVDESDYFHGSYLDYVSLTGGTDVSWSLDRETLEFPVPGGPG